MKKILFSMMFVLSLITYVYCIVLNQNYIIFAIMFVAVSSSGLVATIVEDNSGNIGTRLMLLLVIAFSIIGLIISLFILGPNMGIE